MPSISSQAIAQSTDDATEGTSGTTITNEATSSSQLDATTEWAGFRWDISGNSIAAGSTITAASVVMNFPNTNLDEPLVTLFMERGSAPTTFVAAANNNNISNRSRTTASASWSSTDLGASGDFTSPSLVSVLQEVVDNHAPLTSIVLIVQGANDSSRDFSVTCYDGTPSSSARLSVTWTTASGDTNTRLIGGDLISAPILFGRLVQ